jgi:hypothetical protein
LSHCLICDCEIERAPRRSMTPSPGSRLLKGLK